MALSVRASLAALVAAVLLPLTLACAVFLARQWEDERVAALERLQSQAHALQVAVDRELALDLAVLQTLASSTAVDREDWGELHSAATRAAALRPGGLITVFAPDGQNLINSTKPHGTPLPNILRRPAEGSVTWNGREVPLPEVSLFTGPFQTGQPAFSGVVWGRLSQRPVVATHLPVMRDGRAVLVVGLAYGADAFGRLVAATAHSPGLVKAVVDRRGLLVARHPRHDEFVARRAPHVFARADLQLPPTGTGRGKTLEGQEVFFAHSRSAINGWTVVVAMPVELVLARAWQTLWTSLAGLVVAAVLASLLAAWLGRRLATPLRLLAEQAATPGTAQDQAVGRSRIKEVDTLAEALAAARQTQQQRARIESEREEAREHLRRVNDELTRANRHKDEFIAMLSHELRNPLAPIRNSLFILNRAEPGGSIAQRARNVIERQVAHMARLVDDLLDITRMARGGLELRLSDVNLIELVTDSAQDHRDLLASRGLAFELDLPTAPLWVRGDSARLSQVVSNLIQNAAKFTEPGGRVLLRAARSGDHALIEVIDTGAGIAPEKLAAIFDRLFRGTRTSPARPADWAWGSRSCAAWSPCTEGMPRHSATDPGAAAASWCACRPLRRARPIGRLRHKTTSGLPRAPGRCSWSRTTWTWPNHSST